MQIIILNGHGDPFHPIVNIEAVYKTQKKVDFSPYNQ